MEDATLTVRRARPNDADEIARVYVESWQDTYAGILPQRLLLAMSPQRHRERWRMVIGRPGPERVLVAELGREHVIGMTSYGPARDGTLGYDGEIYTLYVDPAHYGRGTGRLLMRGAFEELRARGFHNCIIWAHARNPARFFYERMGGRIRAERTGRMMSSDVPETAFGWNELAILERSPAR